MQLPRGILTVPILALWMCGCGSQQRDVEILPRGVNVSLQSAGGVLREGFLAIVHEGVGLPMEAFQRAYVVLSDGSEGIRAIKLLGLDGLAGRVRIADESHARRFVRIFSERSTYFLSEEINQCEVVPRRALKSDQRAEFLILVPDAWWDSHGLRLPKIRRIADGFRIERVVLRSKPPFDSGMAVVVERVGRNGEYELERVEWLEDVSLPVDGVDFSFE